MQAKKLEYKLDLFLPAASIGVIRILIDAFVFESLAKIDFIKIFLRSCILVSGTLDFLTEGWLGWSQKFYERGILMTDTGFC